MKAIATLSVVMGFFFGLFTYFILRFLELDDALLFGFFGGLGVALLLFATLIVSRNRMDKRYAKLEKEIVSPIFHKTSGNFNLGNGRIRNGNIYFCEAGIVFISLDAKPYALEEIHLQDIDRYTYTLSSLCIYTKDDRVYLIALPKAAEIIDLLIRKGWIIPRN